MPFNKIYSIQNIVNLNLNDNKNANINISKTQVNTVGNTVDDSDYSSGDEDALP